jgi:hypothetical protein
LLLTLLLRDGLPAAPATAAAALGALSGNHVWFVFSGMEATLLVALSLAVLESWTRPTRSSASAFTTGGLLALAFLTRPEAGALALLVVATTRYVGRPWSHSIRTTLPVALVASLYAAVTRSGPTTLSGRRWMWLADGEGADQSLLALRLLERWAERLARFVLGTESPAVFWIVFGFALLGIVLAVVRGCRSLQLLVSWAALHLATYAVLMPTEGHGGRYQPLTCLLFPALALLGLTAVLTTLLEQVRSVGNPKRVAVGVASVALAIPALVTLDEWGGLHASAVRHVNDTEVKMGLLLRRVPGGVQVASFDVGGIAYFSRRPLLDLGALFDPAILAFVSRGETDQLLTREGIDYVVVPMGYSNEFPDPWNFKKRLGLGASGTLSLKPVLEYGSDLEVWRAGLEATLHCSPRQVLFEVQR